MELFIFARFHAREGQETAVAAALREVVGAYRSTREPRLFYIHSRWVDEAAFEAHAELPHTVRFLERIQPLIDHPFEATRSTPIG
jgi:quinol monooxygenase YgiN